jgi:NitT/TauT family transport system permease protein
MNPRNWEMRWAVATIAVLLLAWQFLARLGRIPSLYYPAPTDIASSLARMVEEGRMWRNLAATLRRVGAALLLGGLPGWVLGLCMGWSRRLRAALDPLVAALHPLPKITLLPLIMLVMGIGEGARVVAVAMASFFPMLISTAAGVRQIRPIYFEVADNYGARGLGVIRDVVLPGSLPMAFSGARLAMNSALVVAVSVEVVASDVGLGALVWFAWQTLRTSELYAALVVIAMLGVLLNALLQRVSQSALPWHHEGQRE